MGDSRSKCKFVAVYILYAICIPRRPTRHTSYTSSGKNLSGSHRPDIRLYNTLLLLLLFSLALQPSAGYGLLVTRGFLITHNDASQSVGLLLGKWSTRRRAPCLDNTQHTQLTNINAPGGIRTQDRCRRAAVDLRIRPRGHWDRHTYVIQNINSYELVPGTAVISFDTTG
jgi:hypothetical protein